jgi:adenylate cyclase
MGADEVSTLKGLTERRAILDGLIGEHSGRIANTAGDSVLTEFGRAVDAVQCALEAQATLSEANASLALVAVFPSPVQRRTANSRRGD